MVNDASTTWRNLGWTLFVATLAVVVTLTITLFISASQYASVRDLDRIESKQEFILQEIREIRKDIIIICASINRNAQTEAQIKVDC